MSDEPQAVAIIDPDEMTEQQKLDRLKELDESLERLNALMAKHDMDENIRRHFDLVLKDQRTQNEALIAMIDRLIGREADQQYYLWPAFMRIARHKIDMSKPWRKVLCDLVGTTPTTLRQYETGGKIDPWTFKRLAALPNIEGEPKGGTATNGEIADEINWHLSAIRQLTQRLV